MSKKQNKKTGEKGRSTQIIIAQLGLTGVIVSALIVGIFGYLNSRSSANSVSENKSAVPAAVTTQEKIVTRAPQNNDQLTSNKKKPLRTSTSVGSVHIEKNNGQINIGTQHIQTQTNIIKDSSTN
jgi:hypothetical protein